MMKEDLENIICINPDDETENVVRARQTDDTWTISTFDRRWDRKLRRFSDWHPDLCVQYCPLDEYDAARYEIAKEIVTIVLHDPDTGKSIALAG